MGHWDKNDLCAGIERYSTNVGFPVACFIAVDDNGSRVYVLFDPKTKKPIYDSQSVESLGIWIDLQAAFADRA